MRKRDEATRGSRRAWLSVSSMAPAAGLSASVAPWNVTATCAEGKSLTAFMTSPSRPLAKGGRPRVAAGPKLRVADELRRDRNSSFVDVWIDRTGSLKAFAAAFVSAGASCFRRSSLEACANAALADRKTTPDKRRPNLFMESPLRQCQSAA